MKTLFTSLLALLATITCNAQISYKAIGDTLATSLYGSGKPVMINVLGDSYVRNHRRPYEETWHYKSALNNGLQYNNYGRNGSCIAFDRSAEGFGPSLLVRYRDMDPNADIVLIIAGHNDAGIIKDDKVLLTQFVDSVSKLIDNVRMHCPNATLGWVTPWYVDRPGFKETIKIIKKVCRRKHVPVLDNYKKSSLIKVRDAEFRKRYFQGDNDTAHLNAAGHDLFYPVGNSFIKKLIQKK